MQTQYCVMVDWYWLRHRGYHHTPISGNMTCPEKGVAGLAIAVAAQRFTKKNKNIRKEHDSSVGEKRAMRNAYSWHRSISPSLSLPSRRELSVRVSP